MKKTMFIMLVMLFTANISKGQTLLAIPDTISGTNFNLNIYDTSKVFYSGFTTNTYGINTNYLGPTLFLNQGDSVSMNVYNHLADTTTIHWHGLHVSAMNDGGPHITIPPNTLWNPKFKVRDNAATYWYHPHLHMNTNLHATLGAAGIIIVRDPVEKALNLPRKYGVDDFPLVIQSKCFDANKQIVINNALDNVMMVNGTLNAYLPTPAQVVRFRLLNASSERVYNVGLQGNLTFYQIGTDGGLLNAPVALTRLRLTPGERAEIVIDLTGKAGQIINLMSFASELPNGIYGASNPSNGMGTITGYSSNTLNGANFNLLQFQVVAQTANPVTSIPSSLINNTAWNTSQSNATRTLTFAPKTMGPNQMLNGPFVINNASFDMNVVNYTIPKDNIEIWTLTNQTAIAHPFHIHDIQFYVLEINGSAPPANFQGRKDVVLVPAQQSVKFITKFETFCDATETYMYHCHMLPHEDDGMMGQFIVTCPTGTGVSEFESNVEDLTIYPNPSSNKINIKLNSNETISNLAVFDYTGKLVFQNTSINLNQIELDLDTQPSGIYLLEIKISDRTFYKKINLVK